MRKFNAITMLVIGLLMGTGAMAQDILVVDPGSGTLNAAIEANGGDKIYQLQAGQWYGYRPGFAGRRGCDWRRGREGAGRHDHGACRPR